MDRLGDSIREAVGRLRAPDLRSRIDETRDVPSSVEFPTSLGGGHGGARRFGVIVTAFVVSGVSAAFAWSAFSPTSDGPKNASVSPAPAGSSVMATNWFRFSAPPNWQVIIPESLEAGEGIMAAQVSNFHAGAPLCLGETTGGFPTDGVLLRLTIGSELAWEGNTVLPRFERTISAPPSVGTFVDDCGVTDRRFGMFFGPDGHLMTAHALIGPDAPSSDVDALTLLLQSLAPTGHAPAETPNVEVLFAQGTDPSIGPWAMGLRDEPAGATTVSFRTEDEGWGIYIDGSSPALQASIGTVAPGKLLVMGIGPAETSSVTLEVDGGSTLTGSILPFPEGKQEGSLAFWIEPFEGALAVEGQQLRPGAVLVLRDSTGGEVARYRLP